MDRKKFLGLEGMRLLAFLNVFWLHTREFSIFDYHESAAWAVSFFFVLSGFLYGNKYYISCEIPSVKQFVFAKLKKFWPLHLFTTLLMFGYSGIFVKSWQQMWEEGFIKKVFLNISLLMSWSRDSYMYYSFTGVAWYLSDLLFLIILTVPILKAMDKYLKHIKHMILFLFIILFISFAYYFMIIYFCEHYSFFEGGYSYYLYVFPPARLFEYAAGITLGRIMAFYSHFNNKVSIWSTLVYSILEITVLCGLIFNFEKIEKLGLFWHSTIWIIPNLIIIWLFALEKGIVSRYVFGNRIISGLGGYTFDAYLVHQVVNIYFSNAMGMVPGLPFYVCLRAQVYILTVCFLFAYLRNGNSKYLCKTISKSYFVKTSGKNCLGKTR